ncbi:MAG: ATP synthase F1 subunit epsilon [Puniceicoccales bacterium]|jgi:F-type H+-transporting ATPase subunit epsilon|nr:ATP synthase F1 subunit epsilon [Puniceicoccales bacterium]
MALFVEIMTPNRVICSKEVASLVVDSVLGEMEILPEHRPIIALLEVGSTRLKLPDGQMETIATSSGILKLENDRVILVVEEAVNIHGLRAAMTVEHAKTLAKEALRTTINQGNLEQNELEHLEARIRAELNKRLQK